VQATGLDSFLPVANAMGAVALFAWALTFLGLLRRLTQWVPNAWSAPKDPQHDQPANENQPRNRRQ
jgi:hypothetical protein